MQGELENFVEDELRRAGVKFARDRVVGLTRPDFVVTTDRGREIVLDVRDWKSSSENTARAINMVNRYKELSKASAALIVTPEGEDTTPVMVSVSELVDRLEELEGQLQKLKGRKPTKVSRKSPKRNVFASMPFGIRYDDTFLVAIQPAALTLNAIANRVDMSGTAGDVVKQIREMIESARLVVADLSEVRANVFHEVGFAEALGKPVIQICSTPIEELPFNVRNNRTLSYDLGSVAKFKRKLQNELANFL